MSSAGRAASSSGCFGRPRGHETGLTGYAESIQHSSPTGSSAMETAEYREPYESRGSRTDLGAPGGENPPGDSTTVAALRWLADRQLCTDSGHSSQSRWSRFCLTQSSPLSTTSSRRNNARVSSQFMLPTGSQTADVTLPKNPLTAGAERSQPAFINKREGTCGQTARLEQEGREAWQF